MFKKNFLIIALQAVVISAFIMIAAGSGTDGAATTNAAKGFGQGFYCGSNGYTMIGSASSESACARKCEANGYRGSYCYGDQGGCFCK